jgi:hypothetical protein
MKEEEFDGYPPRSVLEREFDGRIAVLQAP